MQIKRETYLFFTQDSSGSYFNGFSHSKRLIKKTRRAKFFRQKGEYATTYINFHVRARYFPRAAHALAY